MKESKKTDTWVKVPFGEMAYEWNWAGRRGMRISPIGDTLGLMSP